MSVPESPFGCALLPALLLLGSALLFPSYWFIDRLLSCVVLTSRERAGGAGLRALRLLGVPFFLLLFLLSLVPGFFGFLLWAPLQAARRPFSYQRAAKHKDPPLRSGDQAFSFISANLCLLPDGLARFSNLSHSQCRATFIARLLCPAPEGSRQDTPPLLCPSSQNRPQDPPPLLCSSSQNNHQDTPPLSRPEDILPMMEIPQRGEACPLSPDHAPFQISMSFPRNADFVCLQEVFDGRASRTLRRCLRAAYPHILYDVGPCGPHKCGFKFFNSGLFLASRHPIMAAQYYYYPNGRGEDALAAKGLLCVKVQVGVTEWKQRIVGYINCTHLHAPESDAEVRCDQMSLLLRWVLDFQGQFGDEDDLVAFDILCGDLNFDNCSSDDCLEQKHGLFSAYRDPCRLSAGRDRPGTVGTLLRADALYHPAVSTPASLKSTLESQTERKLYVAPPLPEDLADSGDQWTGRRIDYVLYKESDTLLPLAVTGFQFITQLAGLSDHIPVSLLFSVSLPEVTPL